MKKLFLLIAFAIFSSAFIMADVPTLTITVSPASIVMLQGSAADISGVVSTGFECRLKGASGWTAIPADASFFATTADLGLATGTYEFRAAVVTSGSGTLYSRSQQVMVVCDCGVITNVCSSNCLSSSHIEEGVLINGVRWATRNVCAPGTFAENPEDAGMFYQWNRNSGWCSTDPMVNSNGGTTWDSSYSTASTWEKSNDPSPAGWRVPTYAEIRSLCDANKVDNERTTENGIAGRKFTDKATGNTLFLPAFGIRGGSNGARIPVSTGNYWSSTPHEINEDSAHGLSFDSYSFGGINGFWSGGARWNGFNVRAVAE